MPDIWMTNLGTEPKTTSKTKNVSERYGKGHGRHYEKGSHKIRRNMIHNQGGIDIEKNKMVEMAMNRTYDKRQQRKLTEIIKEWQPRSDKKKR